MRNLKTNKLFKTFTIAIFIFTIALKIFNLKFIVKFLNYLPPLACLGFMIAWILLLAGDKVKKRRLIKAAAVLMIFLLYIIFPFLNLFYMTSGNVYYEEASPTGKNKVIVFEDGFIDKEYHAYPKVLGIFYRLEDNGYVSKHDLWGGADIEIDWKTDDLAYVKIKTEDFYPNPGSNDDDIIIVSFDS